MKRSLQLITWFATGVLFLTQVGCKDKAIEQPCLANYNMAPLLQNYADSLILKSYNVLSSELEYLHQLSQNATSNTDEATLANLRNQFIRTYQVWQYASLFEFGPAEEQLLRSNFNNFPLNESQTLTKIHNKNYDFTSVDAYERGLPALDFLFYGIAEDDHAIIDSLNTNPNYIEYANAVLTHLLTHLQKVTDGWKTYRSTFLSRTGTASGESLSLLVNAINQHFELIKRNKIGIPSGVLSLGFTNPMEVEALNSEISVSLMQEAINASYFMFNGTSINGNKSEGLADLLQHVNANKNGEKLSTVINNQYASITAALQLIDSPLSTAVDNQKAIVTDAYNQISSQVVLLKSDMPSVICIAITYVDNPSDSD